MWLFQLILTSVLETNRPRDLFSKSFCFFLLYIYQGMKNITLSIIPIDINSLLYLPKIRKFILFNGCNPDFSCTRSTSWHTLLISPSFTCRTGCNSHAASAKRSLVLNKPNKRSRQNYSNCLLTNTSSGSWAFSATRLLWSIWRRRNYYIKSLNDPYYYILVVH